MGIDRGRLEVGVAEGGRHERYRCPVVDCMAGVGVPQPMHGDGRVDPGIIDLIGVNGYYTFNAMMMNVARSKPDLADVPPLQRFPEQ